MKETSVTTTSKEKAPMTLSTADNQALSATSLDTGPVEAYAKLEGQDFCYYIRTLQVTLGRKVNRHDKADKVDIPLGNTKLVSRQHARLFYNFTTQRFEMMVIGKNGAFVNGQFIERGVTIPLENRTKITIGEVNFIFLLPYMDVVDGNHTSRNDSTPSHSEKQRKRKTQQQDISNSSLNSTNGNNQFEDVEEEQVDEELKKTLIGYPGVPNPYIGKEDKPPFSYANLIAQALNNASTDKRMTLNEIYTYLSTAYPYFKKVSSTGWQNSVRHNLSLNKAFIKMPRSNNDSGKGAFWTIDPKLEYSIFATNVPMKQRNSKRSSGLSSPASRDGDDDSPTTVAGGLPSKRQRKDKNKDGDGTRKNQATKGSIPSPTSDTMEKASSLASTITPTTPSSSPTQLEISEDVGNTKDKQQKLSKSKTTDSSPSSSNFGNDLPNALAAPPTPPSAISSDRTTISSSSTQAPANSAAANVQVQLQLQLQNTIRQHLLDPIRYPLPPTIAQLLPQAIAQLPPQIANQLSSTLNVALRAQQQHQQQQQQKSKENQPPQQNNGGNTEELGSQPTQPTTPSDLLDGTTINTNSNNHLAYH